MREIKFRAWDEDRKKIIYEFNFNIEEVSKTDYCLIPTEEKEIICGNYMDNGDWQEPTLMQYIGLKDRNGKEGYKSDIVKTPNPNEELFVIDWFEDTASWVLIGQETGKVRWIENREMFKNDFQVNFLACEIIGNTFENLTKH